MELIGAFFSNTDNLILFVLPFAIVFIVMAWLRIRSPERRAQREAYIAATVAAVVAVVISVIRGGPEPFVLIWNPLIAVVVTMPFGFAAAMALSELVRKD